MDFCQACGLPLDEKFNKKWDNKVPRHCNKICEERGIREARPKNRKKYGATGYIYD